MLSVARNRKGITVEIATSKPKINGVSASLFVMRGIENAL